MSALMEKREALGVRALAHTTGLRTKTKILCQMKIKILPLTRPAAMAALCCCFTSAHAAGAAPLVQLRGIDFNGGAQSQFGAFHHGREGVNYVYAQPTGPESKMTATFALPRASSKAMFLYLEAMDDDASTQCAIELALNGQSLYAGPSGFPDAIWQVRSFPIPVGVLQAGGNELRVSNAQTSGAAGGPPWFMVARCAIAGAGFKMAPLKSLEALHIDLPHKTRPFPEPLPAGQTEPGFKFRGTKGWFWTPEQYLAEVPILARFKMNFLMNCYSSLFTSAPGEPWKNEWWKPLPEEKKAAYAQVFRACQEQGIIFCFAVHPQLASPRPLNIESAEDLDRVFQHYTWAQSEGVKWFSVSLDDVGWGKKGAGFGGGQHAKLVNAVFARLRTKDPEAQLIFCPTPYWGDGSPAEDHAYLEALGRDMHPDVYVFWTGDSVVTPRITRRAAVSYKSIVKHRLFLWDNYPVNDHSPTLHLGPVAGRDSDLGEVIDGYMSNPLCPQNQINRIPLLTCADYAYNPKAYDPQRSIGQAILHLTEMAPQRRALKELVEAYPGMLCFGAGTGFNPVRQHFSRLLSSGSARSEAEKYLRGLEALAVRLDAAFPSQFQDARKTLRENLAAMNAELAQKGSL